MVRSGLSGRVGRMLPSLLDGAARDPELDRLLRRVPGRAGGPAAHRAAARPGPRRAARRPRPRLRRHPVHRAAALPQDDRAGVRDRAVRGRRRRRCAAGAGRHDLVRHLASDEFGGRAGDFGTESRDGCRRQDRRPPAPLRRQRGRRRRRPRGRAGRDLRLPRPERRREVHHRAHAVHAAAADRRAGRPWPGFDVAAEPERGPAADRRRPAGRGARRQADRPRAAAPAGPPLRAAAEREIDRRARTT